MLLDELMGWACTAAGMPGMTLGLQLRYHRPVPLQTPLHLSARVTGTDDRKIFLAGSITTDYDRSAILVSADGTFVAPDPDRALFLKPKPASPAGAWASGTPAGARTVRTDCSTAPPAQQ
nr:hotdog fold domain-containing protein [Streptomyces sp. Rer75]